jgi:bifunctional UDP-N-acetylglucosamine pyrophosphorylase/glucosamine-1-phosphate N-acetyltransferase
MRAQTSSHGKSFAVIIMAAGKGTRLKSSRAKVLHEIGGKPLLSHVIAAAAQIVSPQDIYVIIGHQAEQVRSAVGQTGVKFILQAEQRGTGHAIMCARDSVAGYDDILVLSGDVPLIRTETIARLRDFHLTKKAAMTILTAEPAEPFGYGRSSQSHRGTESAQQDTAESWGDQFRYLRFCYTGAFC